MAMKTFTPIRGKKFRVVELDDCGKILATSRYYAGEGFVTVTLTPNVEEGTSIQLRNANGGFCVNEKGNPSFTNFGLEMEFCQVNPCVASIMTNAEEYPAANGDSIGFTVAEGEITGKFALELWTGTAGVACGATGDPASGYILLPLLQAGTIGDLTIDGENAATFKVANAVTAGNNGWGTGKFNVVNNSTGVASKLPVALDPLDHLLMIYTEMAPPVNSTACAVVPD